MAEAKKAFLEDLLIQLLNEHGFDQLSPEDQKGFLPQFVAEAEKRMGAVLMPYIKTDQASKEFENLVKSGDEGQAWLDFWKKMVPNFEEVVKKTLQDFAKEMEAAFKI